ncbi:double-strand break repair protein AddB [Bosea sp. Tri-44]|uniref:double-strand break repair protein AddB n=1 Tax=Bosea sp. Tri-44 TaxID=1972137 RepID=UPI0013E917E0|nr:double-strand break repair protein AddB [Bosea sp. Tri-44]
MAGLNLFNIPAGAPFLSVLAEALLAGRFGKAYDPADPTALSRTTLYLPTRRAARAFSAVLSEKLGGRPLLLPRIVPLGDVDEAETALIASASDALALERTAPIDPLRRRFILTTLISAWGRTANRQHLKLDPAEPSLMPATLAEAWGLAGDLAHLLDQLQTEGVSPARLKGLDAARFDEIWQFNARFLDIIAEAWPAILEQRGECDPAEFRNRMLAAERDRLLAGDFHGPVIAAGSTGTVPATARLLAALARAPNGAVVLPDLDEALSEQAWRAIVQEPAPSHPQAALHRLLDEIGADRDEVVALAQPSPALALRRDLLRRALLPASVTDDWAGAAPIAAGALDGLRIVEAADEREEALAAALALREALEEPGARAALITPDRGLAERVAVELRRWGIQADDSAGMPLGRWPAGALLRLALDAVEAELSPASLVALLAHPHCRLGLPEPRLRQGAAALEIGCWRGEAVGPGFAGLRRAFEAMPELRKATYAPRPRRKLTDEDISAAEEVLAALEDALAPLVAALVGPASGLREIAAQARRAVETLSGDEAGVVLAWRGPDGEALAALFDDLEAALPEAPSEGRARDLIAILEGLIGERVVQRRDPGHPRVKIWGLLEARLLEAEHVVLGGLIESVWPPATETDSFINRPMRAELGLSPPERRIGQTAHDFVAAALAGKVTLTRARKAGEAETIPSRFWQRLKAVAPADAWAAAEARGRELTAWAGLLGAPADLLPVPRPKPYPAPHLQPKRFSVTEVETLYRDPYALYARKILRLDALPELVEDPGATDRGSLLHDIVGTFAQTHPEHIPAGALGSLIEIGERFFRAYEDTPEVRAFWWPRFLLIAQNFLGWEERRRPGLARIAVERDTQGEFPLADGSSILLTGRADRVEITREGALRIIDFKTGAPPSDEQVRLGFAPQLTLEAELAQRHGFTPDILPGPVEALMYLRLNHDPKSWDKDKKLSFKDETQADVTARHLVQLLDHLSVLRAGREPWLSRRAPAYIKYASPYDQLARVKEWSAAPDLGGDAGDEA